MDLQHLRCFVAAADELHFGRAAQRLGVLPAALGRSIRQLEDHLGAALFARTTRAVALTPYGDDLLEPARRVLAEAEAEAFATRARSRSHATATILRVGAVDSAAAGLLPMLIADLRMARPDLDLRIVEDKTARLLPRLLSGRLDLAFVRPPDRRDRALRFEHVLSETAVVATPARHALARKRALRARDLADAPMIVPDRRARPHSHDLTMKLFLEAGLTPRVAQTADEKQTILTLVAAGLGLAIVPRWTTRLAPPGVVFIPLRSEDGAPIRRLPLAAATLRDARDPARDAVLDLLRKNLRSYAASA